MSYMLMFLLALISFQSFASEIKARPRTVDLIVESRRAWDLIVAGKTDSAVTIYNTIVALYNPEETDSVRLSKYGSAMVNLGYYWLFYRNNPVMAFPWLDRGRRLGEKHDLGIVKVGAYDNLGKIYADYKSYDKAREYYRMGLREAVSESMLTRLEWGVSMCFLDLVDLAVTSSQIESLDGDIALIDSVPFTDYPMSQYTVALSKGVGVWIAGNPAQAVSIFRDAESKIDALSDVERYHIRHNLLVGEALIASGEYRSGLGELYKAEALASKMHYSELLESIYRRESKVFGLLNMPDSASYYGYRAMILSDSLYNARRYEIIKDLETGAIQTEMAMRIQSEARRAEINLLIGWISAVVVLVVVSLLLWLYYNYRRLCRTNRELYKKNMELVARPFFGPMMGLEQPGLSHSDVDEPVPDEDNNNRETENGLQKAALDFFENSREIFESDFSIDRLARQLGTRPRILTDLLTDCTGKNFKSLLIEYRIREACRLFSDKSIMARTTIEGVAEKVGYRSRTHFSKLFKEQTGMTASEFMRQALKN